MSIQEAKTELLELLDQVANGEHIIIANHNGRAIAELRPVVHQLKERRLGALTGKIDMADDFNAPMSEEELAEWER